MKIDVEALRVTDDEKVSLADRPTSVEPLYGDAAKLLNRSRRPTLRHCEVGETPRVSPVRSDEAIPGPEPGRPGLLRFTRF